MLSRRSGLTQMLVFLHLLHLHQDLRLKLQSPEQLLNYPKGHARSCTFQHVPARLRARLYRLREQSEGPLTCAPQEHQRRSKMIINVHNAQTHIC